MGWLVSGDIGHRAITDEAVAIVWVSDEEGLTSDGNRRRTHV